jgi:hypothetical protein
MTPGPGKAGGETERTTAHLSNVLGERYYELEILHGDSGAAVAAASHPGAIAWIEAMASQIGWACEFELLQMRGLRIRGQQE